MFNFPGNPTSMTDEQNNPNLANSVPLQDPWTPSPFNKGAVSMVSQQTMLAPPGFHGHDPAVRPADPWHAQGLSRGDAVGTPSSRCPGPGQVRGVVEGSSSMTRKSARVPLATAEFQGQCHPSSKTLNPMYSQNEQFRFAQQTPAGDGAFRQPTSASFQGDGAFRQPTSASFQGDGAFRQPANASIEGDGAFRPMKASLQGDGAFRPMKTSFQGDGAFRPTPNLMMNASRQGDGGELTCANPTMRSRSVSPVSVLDFQPDVLSPCPSQPTVPCAFVEQCASFDLHSALDPTQKPFNCPNTTTLNPTDIPFNQPRNSKVLFDQANNIHIPFDQSTTRKAPISNPNITRNTPFDQPITRTAPFDHSNITPNHVPFLQLDNDVPFGQRQLEVQSIRPLSAFDHGEPFHNQRPSALPSTGFGQTNNKQQGKLDQNTFGFGSSFTPIQLPPSHASDAHPLGSMSLSNVAADSFSFGRDLPIRPFLATTSDRGDFAETCTTGKRAFVPVKDPTPPPFDPCSLFQSELELGASRILNNLHKEDQYLSDSQGSNDSMMSTCTPNPADQVPTSPPKPNVETPASNNTTEMLEETPLQRPQQTNLTVLNKAAVGEIDALVLQSNFGFFTEKLEIKNNPLAVDAYKDVVLFEVKLYCSSELKGSFKRSALFFGPLRIAEEGNVSIADLEGQLVEMEMDRGTDIAILKKVHGFYPGWSPKEETINYRAILRTVNAEDALDRITRKMEKQTRALTVVRGIIPRHPEVEGVFSQPPRSFGMILELQEDGKKLNLFTDNPKKISPSVFHRFRSDVSSQLAQVGIITRNSCYIRYHHKKPTITRNGEMDEDLSSIQIKAPRRRGVNRMVSS